MRSGTMRRTPVAASARGQWHRSRERSWYTSPSFVPIRHASPAALSRTQRDRGDVQAEQFITWCVAGSLCRSRLLECEGGHSSIVLQLPPRWPARTRPACDARFRRRYARGQAGGAVWLGRPNMTNLAPPSTRLSSRRGQTRRPIRHPAPYERNHSSRNASWRALLVQRRPQRMDRGPQAQGGVSSRHAILGPGVESPE